MKLEHASHNADLCAELLIGGKYPDWVVTTAFYSSIHYIDYKLFPIEDYNGRKLSNINEAHAFIREKSPHATRSLLVNTHMYHLLGAYESLRNMCHTARYINYKTPPQSAELAVKNLHAIAAYCITENND